jgi:hypothetical protein
VEAIVPPADDLFHNAHNGYQPARTLYRHLKQYRARMSFATGHLEPEKSSKYYLLTGITETL